MYNSHTCVLTAAGNYTLLNCPGTVLNVAVGQAGATSSALTLYDSLSGATPTCSTIAVLSGGCVTNFTLMCDVQRGLQANVAGSIGTIIVTVG